MGSPASHEVPLPSTPKLGSTFRKGTLPLTRNLVHNPDMRDLLTSPLGWISSLGIFALFVSWRARRRPPEVRFRIPLRLIAAAWLVLLLAACPPLSFRLERSLVSFAERWPSSSLGVATGQVQAIFVFSGGIEGSAVAGAPLGTSSRERLHAALIAAQRWPESIVVFSGGPRPGQTIGSGSRMQEEAIALGLAPERIVLEGAARDTRGNALNCAALAAQRGWTRVALVTSPIHMARSRGALSRAGLDSQPEFPASVKTARFEWTDWFPDAGALQRTTAALHEWIGLAYYRIRGWV